MTTEPFLSCEFGTLYLGDSLDVLQTLDANSADAVVTDPPYGLTNARPQVFKSVRDPNVNKGGKGFMGLEWDHGVPSAEYWAEVLRVAKPGAYLLAFGGTRTFHRLTCEIEDAGWDIRDVIMWVYGCLSEDTEVLTKDGWECYREAIGKEILTYDIQTNIYQWEVPKRWSTYHIKSDIAYRIQSDHTDQIVSRGHRCVVEREGKLMFVSADEFSRVESMPALPDNFFGISEKQTEVLQQSLQRVLPRARMGNARAQRTCEMEEGFGNSMEAENEGVNQPLLEGRGDILQPQGELCESTDQACSLPDRVYRDGKEGWLCDGASTFASESIGESPYQERVCSPYQSRRHGQQDFEFDVIQDEWRPQEVRTWPQYKTTLATVDAIEYSGIIFCPTVSSGAFVARRNGKIFITGNSGFPKSLSISKAIDREAGEEREITGSRRGDTGMQGGNFANPLSRGANNSGTVIQRDQPVTDGAKQWDGWGTALKPAWEPIIVARKPVEGTVASNVLKHGTGAINIDGTRIGVGGDKSVCNAPPGPNYKNRVYGRGMGGGPTDNSKGRWPANLIHDGSDEVEALFPDDAARFYYCAKAAPSERGDTNTHPTVKPQALMRYLCKLVTPPGGTVLDPFMGSGSTCLAAKEERFKFTGIDKTPEYCEIAKQRLIVSEGIFGL